MLLLWPYKFLNISYLIFDKLMAVTGP